MKKTFKVVMLPTENYSLIVHSTSRYGGLFKSEHYSPTKEMGDKYQHLYIISDDEIKEGDWFISDKNIIIKADSITHNICKCKKIVATTDSSLLVYLTDLAPKANYPLPQIPESFTQAYIKAYNEGHPITEVDLEVEEINPRGKDGTPMIKNGNWEYIKVIKTRPDNTVIVHQSKMYSRDEVEKLMYKAMCWGYEHRRHPMFKPEASDKWIQDNL